MGKPGKKKQGEIARDALRDIKRQAALVIDQADAKVEIAATSAVALLREFGVLEQYAPKDLGSMSANELFAHFQDTSLSAFEIQLQIFNRLLSGNAILMGAAYKGGLLVDEEDATEAQGDAGGDDGEHPDG